MKILIFNCKIWIKKNKTKNHRLYLYPFYEIIQKINSFLSFFRINNLLKYFIMQKIKNRALNAAISHPKR